MTTSYDMIIRGGEIHDGTGQPGRQADIAIRDGVIQAVGEVTGTAKEVIDADGLIVTPGFVDIHTHYDGHVTWGSHLEPSSAHGVTTVVTGNCGVGFAPCRPEDRETLIGLMEGVEDIPGPVLATGLPWNWETFPEFLDRLDDRAFDMDVGIQLPHAPLRVYVMGERGAAGEPATEDEIAEMRKLASEAIKAGALGFSTSRSLNHRAMDGTPTPSLKATEDELTGIAMGLHDVDAGVLQFISDFPDGEREFAMMRRVAERSGRAMSFSLMQLPHAPDLWREILGWVEDAQAAGLDIKPQVCGRPIGALGGLRLSYNSFSFCPSYQEIAHLSPEERLQALSDPARKAAILAEFPGEAGLPIQRVVTDFTNIFILGDDLNYEPTPEQSLAAHAEKLGRPAHELAYDLLLEDEGNTVFYMPALNYVENTMAPAEEMLRHPHSVLGLGDGGAHCGIICDASFTTHMLTRWAPVLSLPATIAALTSRTAAAVGLNDRGVIAPGYRADFNIIDLKALRLHRPEVAHDLPQNGLRLHQRADGYVATIVRGVVTRRDGRATGALPGRLVRGAQNAPAAA